MALYLDSSALVKLVVRERESAALRRYLVRRPTRVSCALARVEVPRAVRAHGEAAVGRAQRLLASTSLLRIDDTLLDAAALLDNGSLRSLDAIHVAAALALGEELEALVTYDQRMIAAALAMDIEVRSPS